MTYAKPEVTVLGAAAELVQTPSKATPNDIDGSFLEVPAYDLDE